MVAAIIFGEFRAFEAGERVGEDRRAVIPHLPVDPFEAVVGPAREQVAHRLLADMQDVDREMVDVAQDRHRMGHLVRADEQ